MLGLEPARLAEHAMAGGEGAARGPCAAATSSTCSSGAPALRVKTLAGEAPVHWEVHVPLNHGERVVGVATLGGVTEPRRPRRGPTCTGSAGQAALALAEAGAVAERNWLSQVNAAVLDCVREGIALIGLDHELVFANAAMEQLARAAVDADRPRDRGGRCHLGNASVDREAYFAEWEAILADGDDPTGDELVVGGVSLERYTAPVDDWSGAGSADWWSCAT